MAEHPEPPDLEVNIPSAEGLRVTGEEPYHILVLSNLAGSDAGCISGPLADGVVNVSAESFDEVMAEARPKVNYTISDPLASGSVMAEVNLQFDSLKAFGPEALALQLPPTRSLMEIRQRIVARLRGKCSAGELSDAVGRAAASEPALGWLVESIKASLAEPAAPPEAVDALLGQIDLGDGSADESAPPPKSPIGSLVSAAASKGAAVPPGEVSSLRRSMGEIDRRVSAWLAAVIHSPQVQQVESAWRSLAFLVSRIDFRKGVRLIVLHAPRDGMMERFVSAVIDPVFDAGAAAPDLIAGG